MDLFEVARPAGFNPWHWTLDPQGIAWESFHTLDSVPVYGSSTKIEGVESKAACCAPAGS